MNNLSENNDVPTVSGPDLEGDDQKLSDFPSIEGYQVIEKLGEGGMGAVYLSEQQHPIKRKVAIKVIRPGMDSKVVLARFETERQALALLNHDNIAKIFDAGTTDSNHPYFAMEYIKGIPITRYCDQYALRTCK